VFRVELVGEQDLELFGVFRPERPWMSVRCLNTFSAKPPKLS
jgi:hypothetical protein